MLELAESLATWELAELPSSWCKQLGMPTAGGIAEVPAVRLADHRLAYLDYEGPLSGDRGTVHQQDGGTYQSLEYQEDLLRFSIAGNKLNGKATLSENQQIWRLSANQ